MTVRKSSDWSDGWDFGDWIEGTFGGEDFSVFVLWIKLIKFILIFFVDDFTKVSESCFLETHIPWCFISNYFNFHCTFWRFEIPTIVHQMFPRVLPLVFSPSEIASLPNGQELRGARVAWFHRDQKWPVRFNFMLETPTPRKMAISKLGVVCKLEYYRTLHMYISICYTIQLGVYIYIECNLNNTFNIYIILYYYLSIILKL